MLVAGVDEAGRGALAGPVVAGAVLLEPDLDMENCPVFSLINDSKKLTDIQRREVFEWLQRNVIFGLGILQAEEIDAIGIKKATEKAMNIAVEALSVRPEKLLVDGRDKFQFAIPSEDIVKGDEKELSISAASIIAKVTRDNFMLEMDHQYPQFGFAAHKGYGAKKHCELLDQGVYCLEHRKTYDPLKTWLNQGRLF